MRADERRRTHPLPLADQFARGEDLVEAASSGVLASGYCKNVPTAIDLFAGAGGATAGLKTAHFDVIGAVEWDKDASDSFRANHPEVALKTADIVTLCPEVVMAEWQLRRGELSLLKGCPPCQGFSTLGTSDPGDRRNDLLLEVWRWINCFLPKAFLIENVPGIARDRRLVELVGLAREAGYSVAGYNIDASKFGVPQRRRRHIVVGVLSGAELPPRLEGLLSSSLDAEPVTAGEALLAVQVCRAEDPLNVSRSLQPKTLERVKAIPIGGSRFDLPKNLELACHKRLAKAGSRAAAGPYGRVRLGAPAPTMTTRCTTVACGPFIHPTLDRGLTLREAAVLQTFALDYVFKGSYGSIERQIGNAVPVRLAAALGNAIRQLVLTANDQA